MVTISSSLEHPIIFLFDFENRKMIVPEYDHESTVSYNDSCISIKALSDVDGDVEITMGYFSNVEINDLREVFSGNISLPNKKISIVTSLNEKIIELDVENVRSIVTIFVDDDEFPSRILVALDT